MNNDFSTLFCAQQRSAARLRSSSADDRLTRLIALEKAFLAMETDIVSALAEDFGKPGEEVFLTEITPVIVELKHAKRHLREWIKPRKVSTPILQAGTISETRFEGIGPSLIISPWNYPITLSIGPLISAVAAGCPVILKPSEWTPASAIVLSRIVERAFLPEEVCVVTGGVDVARSLLELPFRHIFFTGSPSVGSEIMHAAAKNLARVTLELGGKSPAIVDSSADMRTTVEQLVFGKFANAGQTCIAPDYVLVSSGMYTSFVEKMKSEIARQFSVTDPVTGRLKHLSRIVGLSHYDRLCGVLQDARNLGAHIVTGGFVDRDDKYIEPTLLTDVTLEMTIMKEEIFGPLLPVLPFDTFDEAIRIINRLSPPLTLYLFCRDDNVISRYISSIECGSVSINETLLHFVHPGFPFGGVAQSGQGRAHGFAGFKAFSNQKSVYRRLSGHALFSRLYPPYTEFARRLRRAITKIT